MAKTVDLDNIESVIDTIVIDYYEAHRMGNVYKITNSENEVQFLSQEQLEQLHVMVNFQILQVNEFDDSLSWNETSMGSPVKMVSINCFTIELQISMTLSLRKHVSEFLF